MESNRLESDAVLELFMQLVAISSPAKREAQLATRLVSILTALGATVGRDKAGEFVGGDCGNIIASLPGCGHLADAPPVLLSAHMDTVAPTEGIRASIDDGWVHTDGSTILGADDKAGIAVILQALRELRDEGSPSRPVEVVFTIAEEIGLYGAKYLDLQLITAEEGVVLDSGGPVGTIVTRTPAQDEVNVVFIGRAAHAGVEPEKGVNAIRVAAEAISDMPLGRLDHETTANVGVIEGGTATNIVPDRVTVRGETRGRSEVKLEAQVKSMREACSRAAERHGARFDMTVERSFPTLNLPEDCALVSRMREAAQSAGLPFSMQMRGGGSDANIFNARGIAATNMGLGMENDHSGQERIEVRSLLSAVQMLKAFLSS